MPRTTVNTNPVGLFGPGDRNRAMMPATKPTTTIQMIPDTGLSLSRFRAHFAGNGRALPNVPDDCRARDVFWNIASTGPLLPVPGPDGMPAKALVKLTMRPPMSIFGKIVNAIFGGAKPPAGAAASSSSPAAETAAPAASTSSAASASAAPKPISRAEVEAMVAKIESDRGVKYNWRESIVDLMKLLDLDSSLGARKQLAQELGYKGALDGSAEMNVWLHKQVMEKVAEGGGRVPASLKD